MAKKKKKAGPQCAGVKQNGKLRKGYRYKKGHGCPVPAKGK